MAFNVNFLEVETEELCAYCGRKKLNENDKFYRVLIGDNATEWAVCELCKGGFSTRLLEGAERSYVTHLSFYLKRSLFELTAKLPEEIISEMKSAIENYEAGEYSASFRCIGLVAELLTNKLFTKSFGESEEKAKPTWDNKLGRLSALAKRNENTPQEVLIYQLYSLKWFRNRAVHPAEHKMNADDVRFGLTSIIYVLHKTEDYFGFTMQNSRSG
jgi:hypothetical protein